MALLIHFLFYFIFPVTIDKGAILAITGKTPVIGQDSVTQVPILYNVCIENIQS